MARRLAQPSEKFNKDAIRRELEADARRVHQAKITDLRVAYRKAKIDRDEETRRAIADCRKEHIDKLARARQLHTDAAQLRSEENRLKAEVRARQCRIEGAAKRREKQTEVLAKRKLLAEELRYKRDLAQRRRSASLRFREERRLASGGERRAQSDQEVEGNIEAQDPALVPLWRKVKRSIRARPGMSREEAFYQYVEENPADATEARGETSDEQFAKEMAAAYGG